MGVLLGKIAAVAAVVFGLALVVFAQGCSFLLGCSMKQSYRDSAPPLVVNPHEAPGTDLYATLLELHGTLQSEEEMQLPEYGIRLPAICLLVEVREVAPNPEVGRTELIPLSAEKQAQLGCPGKHLWAQKLHCGAYPLHPDFIPTLLRTRSQVGHICERSMLPLPPEHIHLPEHLQSMARLLPETRRLDRPDCTILHLAERYRDASVPTGEAQHGDIELRFSYLPAKLPVALRGTMKETYLCNTSSACALAAGGRSLPPIEGRFSPLLASSLIFLFPLSLCLALTLGGIAVLKLGMCCLLRRVFRFPMPHILAISVCLQVLAATAGFLIS